MTSLAAILAVAALAHALAYLLRLAPLPLLLASGWILSLTPIAPEPRIAQTILELGLAFVVFSAGMELTPRRFAHETSVAAWAAAVQFVGVGLLAFALARAFGNSDSAAVYMACAMAASSTIVVIRHLRLRRQMFEKFGRLVTGALLMQDAVVLVMLSLLAASGKGSWLSIVQAIVGLVVLTGLAAACHFWFLPRLALRLLGDDEVLLLVAIGLLFVFVAAANAIGLPLAAGAFLAGFSLAAFPVNGLVRGVANSLTDFFQALFLVALGTQLELTGWHILAEALAFAALVLLATPPIVAAVVEWRGQNSRTGIECGLLLAQTSELGIVSAMVGMSLGILDREQFIIVALVAATTMTATQFLATDAIVWKLLHWHPSRRLAPRAPCTPCSGHVLILGFSNAGMWAAKPLFDAGYNLLVIDEDPVVIEALEHKGIPCLRGDGSDVRILESANARSAALIVVSLPKLTDILRVLDYARGVKTIVRVFENSDAEAVERAGGIAIRNSQAACEEFLKWFENFSPAKPLAPAAENP